MEAPSACAVSSIEPLATLPHGLHQDSYPRPVCTQIGGADLSRQPRFRPCRRHLPLALLQACRSLLLGESGAWASHACDAGNFGGPQRPEFEGDRQERVAPACGRRPFPAHDRVPGRHVHQWERACPVQAGSFRTWRACAADRLPVPIQTPRPVFHASSHQCELPPRTVPPVCKPHGSRVSAHLHPWRGGGEEPSPLRRRCATDHGGCPWGPNDQTRR
mmetsp:Transcript_35999/g.99223  ORF Transcript_35999/g.99223 Transcript_35999/m.99223 type:complete len:218 (+) Transcript_35999:427-1080(+)